MEITQERAEAVGEALKLLVKTCNMVTEDELNALIEEGAKIHAFGPMLDPTRYRAEGESVSQGQKVLKAFRLLKQEVKGIGSFK